jgi:hypothetical protein
MAYLYRHIRLDTNEVFYIGIGSDSEYKRAYSKQSRNTHWNNIIKTTSYEVEIILEDLTWEEACSKEIEFIKLYGRRNINEGTLVNMTDGGEGFVGLKFTEDHKHNIAKAATGNRNMVGKHLSNSQKEKLRDANLGKRHTDEAKTKISNAMKGKRSPEFAQKIKDSWVKRRLKNTQTTQE